MRVKHQIIAGGVIVALTGCAFLAFAATNARTLEFVIQQVLKRAAPDVQDFRLGSLAYSFPSSWTLGGVCATVLEENEPVLVCASQVEIKEAMNLLADGKHTAVSVRGGEASYNQVKVRGASCDVNLSRSPEGLMYRGTVLLAQVSDGPLNVPDLKMEFSGTPSGAEAGLSLAVENLAFPAYSLNISNLHASCAMRFPGDLRSQPEQKMTADSLSVGELRITQIRMNYQVEPDLAFFVEDLEFNWCEGRVSLYNARFGPQSTNVSARLFCDRLSLEQVLAACGVTGISAGGELNGRIPVQWTKDGLSIDRGFLFTTPGKGGTFSSGGTTVAAGLLPPGSLEEGQIGLVTAALAAFNYNWITMTLNSEGETLRIQITVEGQPVNILPYEYDSRSGTYVKVALREGRGFRHPMNFELNLTVPLNRLLCYASGIDRQWNLFRGKP